MGLNRSLDYIISNEFTTNYQNFIWACLDDDILISSEKLLKEIGDSMPYFNNFKGNLRNLYDIFNNDCSKNFPNGKKNKRNAYLYFDSLKNDKTDKMIKFSLDRNKKITNGSQQEINEKLFLSERSLFSEKKKEKKLNFNSTQEENKKCEMIFKEVKNMLEVNMIQKSNELKKGEQVYNIIDTKHF